jgi:hypothetical protein
MKKMTRRLTLAAILSVASLAMVSSAAQAAPPTITVKPVFGQALIPGAWQPITVTLTNKDATGDAIDGLVRVAVEDPRYGLPQGLGVFTHPVRLASGAGVASVRLNIQVPTNAVPTLRVTLLQGQGESAFGVETRNFDGIPVKPEAMLRMLAVTPTGESEMLENLNGSVLGVRSVNGTLHLAAPFRRPDEVKNNNSGMNNQTTYKDGTYVPHTVSLIPTVATQLPEQAIGYGAFRVVCFTENPTLSKTQWQALQSFVQSGGTLIVPTRPSWLTQTESVTSFGLGRVVIAPTLPNSQTDWMTLLQSAAASGSLSHVISRESSYYEGYGSNDLYASVLRGEGMQAIPFGTLALFLGTYLMLVVPVQYLLLKRLDRRELAWITTPLLACGFAVAAYQFGRAGRSTEIFHNVASVVEMAAGSGVTSSVASVGLYSPTRSSYNVAMGLPQTAALSVLDSSGRSTPLTIDCASDARVTEFSVAQWAMRPVGFKTTGLTLGNGVATTLMRDGNAIRGTITNNTGKTLMDVRINAGDGQQFVGSLSPGTTVHVSFGAQKNQVNLVYPDGGYLDPSIPTQERERVLMKRAIFGSISTNFFNVSGNEFSTGSEKAALAPIREAVITGWNYDELFPITLEGGVSKLRTSVNAIIVRAPLSTAKL